VIAGIPIFQGDMSFLDRAVLWAKTALDLLPTCRTLRGTYGSLLIESGSLSEGMKMLTPLTEDGNEPTDKAIASAYLAKAHHLLGHANEAELWIARARELKASGCEKVCDRIEVEIRGNLPDVCPAPSSIS
jgi:predicted Zn-dependent protease